MLNAQIVFAGGYTGPGSHYAVDACVPCDDYYKNKIEFKDGYDLTENSGSYWPFGSVIVRPGCQIYLYSVYSTVDSGNSKRLNSKQSLISKHFW